MEHPVSKKIRLLSISLFVVGVVSGAVAYSLQRANGIKLRPAKAFTIVTKETITLNDPKQAQPGQADYVLTMRYQRSDGAWKEEKLSYNSRGEVLKKNTSFGMPDRGVFQVEEGQRKLNFLSSMPPSEVTSSVAITDGHDDPRFSKDEMVLGYKTYVLHYSVDEDGSYEDEYYAPDLDGYPIRTVKVSPHASSITEAIKIVFGEPDESVFSSLPDWTVNYDHFEKKIQAMDDDGQQETAQALRQDLAQHRAKLRRIQ
jgi:hypothetical protein